jgi:D-alanyl-D-alanine carboxypeptidase
VVLAFLCWAGAGSTATTPADVRASLDAVVAAGAPGGAATWTVGGTTRSYSVGVADLRSKRPIRRGDHYRIASQTKTWTATIILTLARDGRLKLSDTVHRWVPGPSATCAHSERLPS